MALGGTVATMLVPQSEPSLVPGTPVFESLTQGFEVRDATGGWLARCVDDLTLVEDLDRQAAPKAGWYRVVSDDVRLLRLLARHADAAQPLPELLRPFAALFGREPVAVDGLWRVADRHGASLCLAAPLPGERERPCELITPPLEADAARALLETGLARARALGFTVPAEAATHLHVDAAPFRDAAVLQRLGRLVRDYGAALRETVHTNPRCVRLGPWSDAVMAVLEAPDFAALPWPAAQARLQKARPTKYVDVNIANLVYDHPDKPTVEIRVLPVRLEGAWDDLVLAGRFLARALDPTPVPPPRSTHTNLLGDVLLGGR